MGEKKSSPNYVYINVLNRFGNRLSSYANQTKTKCYARAKQAKQQSTEQEDKMKMENTILNLILGKERSEQKKKLQTTNYKKGNSHPHGWHCNAFDGIALDWGNVTARKVTGLGQCATVLY